MQGWKIGPNMPLSPNRHATKHSFTLRSQARQLGNESKTAPYF